MQLKNGVTIEEVYDKLDKELASHLYVKIKTNPFYKNIRWVSIWKDVFTEVKVSISKDKKYLMFDWCVPNFLVRAFFGGLIASIFLSGSRNRFINKISEFLVAEFYED